VLQTIACFFIVASSHNALCDDFVFFFAFISYYKTIILLNIK
jgi:hypothetical protein